MEEDLTARLLATPALSALVGNRITWGQRDQDKPLPALVLTNVSPGRTYLHGGADPTANPRIQFDCYGRTASEAKALSRALIGTLESPAVQGATAFSVALLDAERGPLIEDVGGGLKVHRYSLDFLIWFSPAA